jgi:hypothetical protein
MFAMRPPPDVGPATASRSDRLAPPLVKVAAKTAAEVCAVATLDVESLALLIPAMAPRTFLDELLIREHYNDAIKFLAGALPRREAVWWGCLCLRIGIDPAPPALDTALRVAVRWVVQPTEANRQQASRLATGHNPRDFLLRAIAWTGGSLSPAPLPPVPPSPVLTARSIHAALMLAATRGAPEKIRDRLRQFLTLGIHIARGKYAWPEKPPAHQPPACRPTR